MSKYTVELNKGTTSVTIGIGSVAAAGAARRLKLYEYIFGSEGTPADNAFLLELTRHSTVNTGSAITANPLDPADAAAVAIALENLSAEGTLGAVMDGIPTNMRATWRWFAVPGSELVVPATAGNGIVFRTPVAQNTPAGTLTAKFDE